jgi:hypothetical protein
LNTKHAPTCVQVSSVVPSAVQCATPTSVALQPSSLEQPAWQLPSFFVLSHEKFERARDGSRPQLILGSGRYPSCRAEVKEDSDMRHALALSFAALAALTLAPACAENPNSRMQPDPGTGYAVETTGAQIVGRDVPSATTAVAPSDDDIAARLAAQICDREIRCHVATGGRVKARSADDCWRASLQRAHRELDSWRCSPAGARARAEECLAAIGHEQCEHSVQKQRFLCASNAACGADAMQTPSTP